VIGRQHVPAVLIGGVLLEALSCPTPEGMGLELDIAAEGVKVCGILS
jgi:hypothetical protein